MAVDLPLDAFFIPAQRRSGDLLIALHGRGGSMHDFESIEEDLFFPTMNYLYLNAPDPFYQGRSWYDLPPNPLPGIVRSCRLLEDTLHILNSNGYPYSRMVLLGFSQGCLLTLEFGLRFPHLLGAYVGMSGHVYDVQELISTMHPMVATKGRFLVTHGVRDEHLSVEVTRQQIALLQQAGAHIQYAEFDKTHTFDFENEMPMIKRWIKFSLNLA